MFKYNANQVLLIIMVETSEIAVFQDNLSYNNLEICTASLKMHDECDEQIKSIQIFKNRKPINEMKDSIRGLLNEKMKAK